MKASLLLLNLFACACLAFDSTSDCISCFNTKYSNKFCLMNWGSTTGYCCDKTNLTDYCQSTRYFCSDNAPNDAVKLSYCPFQPQQCYGKPVNTLEDNTIQTAATTLSFTTNSVCAWKLRSTSEYYFNKQILVTIEATNGVNCHMATGTTIGQTDSYSSCTAGKTYYVDANQHVFLVVQGTSSSAYMQFSYQLVDRLDIVQISIIYSVSIFTFVMLVGLLMVLTARYCIQQVIKQNQDYWKKMAIEMSNIVRSAQRLKDPPGGVPQSLPLPPPPAPVYQQPPPPPPAHYYEGQRVRSAQHNQIQPQYDPHYPPPQPDYRQMPPPPPPRSGYY